MKALRKFIVTVICLFVPSRLHRHIIRDVFVHDEVFRPLTYIKRYRACQRHLRDDSARAYPHFLSVCAIAKDEGPYLKEWIEFHRLVGVEKFYLYDNESTDDTRDILAPYIESGLVDYTFQPGQKQQLPAYDDCLARHAAETKWLAYIDLDEFMVPMEFDTVPEFLATLPPDACQLLIPWVVYGSDGHVQKPQGLVTESYMRRDQGVHSWMMKSIVKPMMCWHVSNHTQSMVGKTVDENGTAIELDFQNPSIIRPHNKIRINHYCCKSKEEHRRRRTRGDVMAVTGAQYDDDHFRRHDCNDVYDPAMERFLPRLRATMGVA